MAVPLPLSRSGMNPNVPIGLHSPSYVMAVEKLLSVVQQLSLARDLDSVTEVVREAARELTGADGATFILREGENCYYADESAIAPLWKGSRFAMDTCISGWVMQHSIPVKIRNIYLDSRIPINLYHPTFVKSMAMVPIRKSDPIGAIGIYWAEARDPSEEEMGILQALADTTSVALENVALVNQLQNKIAELEESNFELSCFAWAASHDLQEPLRSITTQVELLERRYHDKLDDKAFGHIRVATENARRLQRLIGDLVIHARAGKSESFKIVPLAEILCTVLEDLSFMIAETEAKIEIGDLPVVRGNPHLLACLLRNLLSNAMKFRKPTVAPQITVYSMAHGNEWKVSVRDNGIGMPEDFYNRVFGLFQRANPQNIYAGSGVGLATCKKIAALHGGRIWAEQAPPEGCEFCFTLPIIL